MRHSTNSKSGLLQFARRIAVRDVIGIAYHTFADAPIPHIAPLYGCKTLADFERDLVYVKSHFRIVSHEEILGARENRSNLPPNAAALSFDDGFAECFSGVRPLLLAHGIPATFFVCKNFVDSRDLMYRNKVALCLSRFRQATADERCGLMAAVRERFAPGINSSIKLERWLWSLGYRDLKTIDAACECLGVDISEFLRSRRPYLTAEQINRLHEDGFTIGAHSCDHPPLAELSDWNEVQRQISESCDFVRRITARTRIAFAFPFNGLGLARRALAALQNEYHIDLIYDTNGLMKDAAFIVNRIFCDSPCGASTERSNLPMQLLRAYALEPFRALKRLPSGLLGPRLAASRALSSTAILN